MTWSHELVLVAVYIYYGLKSSLLCFSVTFCGERATPTKMKYWLVNLRRGSTPLAGNLHRLRIYNNIQDKVSRNIFSRSIWLLLVITVLSCFLILRYWAVKIASLPCASMWYVNQYNQFCYFVTRGRVEVVKSKISRQVKSIVESNRRVKETCKFEYPRLKFILKKTRAKRSLNGITTTRENHGNFRIPSNSRLP